MKPTTLLFFIAVFGTMFWCAEHKKKPQDGKLTKLKIYNTDTTPVKVYLTLGATDGCIRNIMAVPFITDSVPGQRGLQGYFMLQPGDSTEAYAPENRGFNGVFSFNYAPDNCPSAAYPNGINQFEFMINNAYQGKNAQESINISCVHGVNCVILVDINSKNAFNAGPDVPEVQAFSNRMNKNATGIVGVYPYGCDTCTGSKTPPSCIELPQPAQKASICQVQRNASLSGGLIKVKYLGNIQTLK